MNLRKIILAILISLQFLAGSAHGAVYMVYLTGTISSKYNSAAFWNDSFNVGSTFTASYRFDTATPDNLVSDPNIGQYVINGTPFAIQIEFGDYTFSTNESRISVYNNDGGLDRLITVNLKNFSQNGLQFFSQSLYIGLQSTNNTLLNDDSLPTGALSAAEFDSQKLVSLQGYFGGETAIAQGYVSAYSVTQIPEPATMCLALAACIVALGARRREIQTCAPHSKSRPRALTENPLRNH